MFKTSLPTQVGMKKKLETITNDFNQWSMFEQSNFSEYKKQIFILPYLIKVFFATFFGTAYFVNPWTK